ncbi:hypothetical protein [Mucilaginibacter arboris]|uniref:Uncharacterized protein n=1 Tax=Mucilaginibacter arboris TaxID=2682090 RepID=A0A7K1SYW9_9SPHI|nr:hypothetical protein [Mucilaginibacter arboris]MVN22457.1 hypothetical protein [Mucilaginibacter arboris]
METQETSYLGVELKPHYLYEFMACGIPVPHYTTDPIFILKFKDAECYLNYRKVLKAILNELDLADPQNCKYEIQHSKAFIRNILFIMREQLSKRYN